MRVGKGEEKVCEEEKDGKGKGRKGGEEEKEYALFVFQLGARTQQTDGRTGKTCNTACWLKWMCNSELTRYVGLDV